MLTLEIAPKSQKLRRISLPVEDIDEGIISILDQMRDRLYEEEAVGFAAPQFGIMQRLVVLDVSEESDALFELINPEIVWFSEEKTSMTEGCFSLPGVTAKVVRPERVTVHFLNRYNKQETLEADGRLARCIQHEVDHLNGILYIDYLSPLKQQMLIKKSAKHFQDA